MTRITHFQAIGYEGAIIPADEMRLGEDSIRVFNTVQRGQTRLVFELHCEGALNFDIELRPPGLLISHEIHWAGAGGTKPLTIRIVREADEQPELLIEADVDEQCPLPAVNAPPKPSPDLN